MLGGTTTTGRIGAQNTVPIRLRAVSGFQNRLNDVVYCPPLIKPDDEPPTSVVYFGGDVQVGTLAKIHSPIAKQKKKSEFHRCRVQHVY